VTTRHLEDLDARDGDAIGAQAHTGEPPTTLFD